MAAVRAGKAGDLSGSANKALTMFGISRTIKAVREGITGRVATDDAGMYFTALYAVLAGHGDHLEIGTLFGGSAIVVALCKQLNGLSGNVICVDPLDGYYGQRRDPNTGLLVNRTTVLQNAHKFGVLDRIEIVQTMSQPWPEELKGREFASAYIDGDHTGNRPVLDWLRASMQTSRYVVFDNCKDEWPMVVDACREAEHTPGWRRAFGIGGTVVMRRENA